MRYRHRGRPSRILCHITCVFNVHTLFIGIDKMNTFNCHKPKATHSRILIVSALCLLLANCATPYRQITTYTPVEELPSTEVYFYPDQNQSPQQQDRDRYECSRWAIQASNYDPAQAQLAPHQKIRVVPETSPGSSVAAGAIVGGIIGSTISGGTRRGHGGRYYNNNNGAGLVFGALTGALIGAASEQASANKAQRIEDTENAKRYAIIEEQARNYRRAITACLEGRNYTVR